MTLVDLQPIIFLVIKVAVLIALGLYLLFAAVLVRQEQLMAHVVEESFRPVLQLIVLIHLISAVGVFILAFILL